jgi:FkbM family methyltransferase
MNSRTLAKISYFARLLRTYWREAVGFQDFVGLLQVRLAQSRGVGRLVCPRPVVRTVRIRSFGGPVTLRSHTTDISVNDELLVSRGYEHLREHATTEPRVIVDLGANIGLVSRWLATAFPRARIIAVEPEPGNLDVLRRNLAPLGSRAILKPIAVSGARGRASISTTSGEHGFTIVAGGGATVVAEVDVTTLGDVLAECGVSHIDVLKSDIEGSERDLFADCSEWIGSVDLLEIECHEPYTLAMLQNDLIRNGATFELLAHQPNPAYHCEVALLRNIS